MVVDYNLLTLIKDSTGTPSISESPALSISTVTQVGVPPRSFTVWITSFAVFSSVTFDVLFGDGCAT